MISSSSRLFCERQVPTVQQTAGQLVEVSLHGLAQLNVDIPVPQGRGGRGGLQDFRSGQDSSASYGADHVDIPVPRGGGLQGFFPRQVSTASSLHSPGAADEAFYMVFSHFCPSPKKCDNTCSLEVAGARALELIHAS